MSHFGKKPVYGVSDQIQHRVGCTVTEDGKRFDISYLGSIYVAKTKALITCAVITPLFLHMQKAGFLMTQLTECLLDFLWLFNDTFVKRDNAFYGSKNY